MSAAERAVAVVDRIRAERVVAILRRVPDVDAAIAAVRQGGIELVEVTLDSEGALEAIARHPGCLAGTVRTAAQVDAAVGAGAIACVSPALVPEVVERCRELGVPAIPGALTPSEIETAWRLGASLVKLFPGSAVGPGYVREVLSPLGGVPLLVTGGVAASNAAAWLEAGAVAVGAGSSLTSAPDMAAAARELVTAVRSASGTKP